MIFILFAIGTVAGLMTAKISKQGATFLYVTAGVAGALLGGVLVAPGLAHEIYDPNRFDLGVAGWACGCALLLVGVAKMVRALLRRRNILANDA